MVSRPDGSIITEFSDGTRITSFYMDTNIEFSSRLNENYETQREKYVKFECHGFGTTIFNSRTSECSIAFGDGTLISCEPKGNNYTVIHRTGELLEITGGSNGSISFLPRYYETIIC